MKVRVSSHRSCTDLMYICNLDLPLVGGHFLAREVLSFARADDLDRIVLYFIVTCILDVHLTFNDRVIAPQ